MENKSKICRLLLPALRETRQLDDLINLIYMDDDEVVLAVFSGGHKKRINVACDSGIAMVKDIVKGLM